MNLQESIERAAGNLPEDWIIELNIERGSAWVTLYDGMGNSHPIPIEGPLSEQISTALGFAIVQTS